MKILFLNSGYKGIYTFFEESIVESLKNLGHVCDPFMEQKDVQKLKNKVQLFQPDLILVMTGFKMSESLLGFIKLSKITSVIWMTEDPYYMDWTIPICPYFDYIFTIDLAALEKYKKLGHPHVYHLPLGTNPDLYRPISVSEDHFSDICLVGVPYTNRIELVHQLLRNTNYIIKIVGRGWKRYLNEWKGKEHLSLINAWVRPQTAANYYNGSKIILNIHRPFDEKYNKNSYGIVGRSINNRTFDAASCEAFQLIDSREDLSLHFEEGKEIISFKNEKDFLEKIHYYMTNGVERKKIANNARARVLSAHTFEHRMNQMILFIKK